MGPGVDQQTDQQTDSQLDAQVALAAQGVLAYLSLHPDAADSVVGIAQWWLPMVQVEVPVEAVQQALDQLVQQSRLQRRALADGGGIYHATPAWRAADTRTARPN